MNVNLHYDAWGVRAVWRSQPERPFLVGRYWSGLPDAFSTGNDSAGVATLGSRKKARAAAAVIRASSSIRSATPVRLRITIEEVVA